MLTVMIVFTAASGGPVMYIRTVEMCVCVCGITNTNKACIFASLSFYIHRNSGTLFGYVMYVILFTDYCGF